MPAAFARAKKCLSTPCSAVSPAACSVGAMSVMATGHGFIRRTAIMGRPAASAPLRRFRIRGRRRGLIERPPVGQHRPGRRRHHLSRVVHLVEINLRDERPGFGKRLIDRRTERIVIGRQHMQRTQQVGRPVPWAFNLQRKCFSPSCAAMGTATHQTRTTAADRRLRNMVPRLARRTLLSCPHC